MSSMASKSTKIMPYLVDTLDITYPLSPPEYLITYVMCIIIILCGLKCSMIHNLVLATPTPHISIR